MGAVPFEVAEEEAEAVDRSDTTEGATGDSIESKGSRSCSEAALALSKASPVVEVTFALALLLLRLRVRVLLEAPSLPSSVLA